MSAAELARALGGATRNGKGWLARCCCHEDKTPSLSLCDGDSRLLVYCFAGCDVRDILAELRCRGLIENRSRDFRPARKSSPIPKPAVTDKPPARVHRIWREAIDPRGTPAEKYLNSRGLGLDDDLAMRVLRYHWCCLFGETAEGITIYRPALIAAFRPLRDDDGTGPPPAIHRIFLDPDGSKIAKKMLGPVDGCAVKLDADDDVTQGLGICEGIETGLAVRATGWRPIWSLGSAGAIAKFAPIPGIECLTIFADNDTSGRGEEAATECARRWADAGREAIVRIPFTTGSDWQDVQP